MGIGNSIVPASQHQGSTHAFSLSLPLMGIGNSLPDEGVHRPGGPHYPSWGSETWTLGLLGAKLDTALISLPLMGIGNPRLPP